LARHKKTPKADEAAPTTQYKIKYSGFNEWGIVDMVAKQIIYSFVDKAAAMAVCDDLNGIEKEGGHDVSDQHGFENLSGNHGIDGGQPTDDDY
jgi:hypothetical protein